MYLPMTRWHRPSPAHAGAKLGSRSIALLIELARRVQPVVGASELVPAQIQLVGTGIVRRVARRQRCPAGQRERQRVSDATGDVVLQSEEIAERRLDGVGRQHRAARRVHQLRRDAQLGARPQQRAHDHAIDVGLGGQRSEIRRVAAEPSRDGTRSKHQRSDSCERRGDRIGQAEREKVGLAVRTQDAEREHDQSRQWRAPARERWCSRGRAPPAARRP